MPSTPGAAPRRAALLALLALVLCCAVDATTNSSVHTYGTTMNSTTCQEWHPDTIAQFEKMLATDNVLDKDQRADLEGYKTHHTIEKKWAKDNVHALATLNDGPCGKLMTRINAKLGVATDASASVRKTPGHAVAALLSLVALARVGAAY